MTRRAREATRKRRPISTLALVVSLMSVLVDGRPADAASLVDPYAPGVVASDLGGDLVVNAYAVDGLGVHRMALDDGSSVLSVCIQANLPHSTSAPYAVSGATANSGALDYLTWRYLAGGSLSGPQAAGLNVAAWGLVGAARAGGGPVWNGGDLSVAVLGVGPRDDIESAAVAFVGEATRRRGPWTLAASPIDGTGAVSVRLSGAGGPISGEAVAFSAADGAWSEQSVTNDDGVATATPPAGTTSVRARSTAPGHAVEYAAAGAQRLAIAGPSEELAVDIALPPAPATTTTTTTTTTTSSTTTTTVPETSTSSTVPATTTVPETTVPETSPASTTPPSASTELPTTSTVAETTPTTTTTTTVPLERTTTPATTTTTTTTTPLPETFPATGSGSRIVVRIGALFFALGGIASYIASGNRRRS